MRTAKRWKQASDRNRKTPTIMTVTMTTIIKTIAHLENEKQ